MKKIHSNTLVPLFALGLLTLMLPLQVFAYSISLRFTADDPVMFPLGAFIPPGVEDFSEIDFQQIEPFFEILVTGTGSDELILHVQFEKDNEPIFTVRSERFTVSSLLGDWLSNQDLARMNEISLGGGGDQINSGLMISHTDGSMLNGGLYLLKVILSTHDNWNDAVFENEGEAVLPINAVNRGQVDLMLPEPNAPLIAYPNFIWQFPRIPGVSFELKIVTGDPDGDPASIIQNAPGEDIVAIVNLPVEHGNLAGEITLYQFTGTEGEDLIPGLTYYWQVTAFAPTIFQDRVESVPSSVYRFSYDPPGAGGFGGGEGEPGGGAPPQPGGGGGGILGGSGEEGPPPLDEDPLFGVLRNSLPGELWESILAALGQVGDYTLIRIRAGDQELTLEELAVLIQTGQIEVTTISISD